jgi:cytochrome c oxidase subunit 4
VEVIIALLGKGHIIAGFYLPVWFMAITMIGISLYKAYFIVNEFMHVRYEVSGLAMSILLPLILLIWAIIAFLYEGNAWKENRNVIQERDNLEAPGVREIGQHTEETNTELI